MNRIRQWWVGAAGAAALVAVIGAGAVMAQTPLTTPATPTTTVPGTTLPGTTVQPTAPATILGVAKSNEDATHEAAETPQHEADENAGHIGRGGGKPNEDPAHEANETAAHEAAEDAGRAPSATPPAN